MSKLQVLGMAAAVLLVTVGCAQEPANVDAGDTTTAGDALAGDALTGDALAGDALAGDALAGDATPQPVVCQLGSVYPTAGVIDPDNPVYTDAGWTQGAVDQAFATAKAQNSRAYQAYAAARDYADLLECPFCSCGCYPISGHLSAVDCFKDMHGYG